MLKEYPSSIPSDYPHPHGSASYDLPQKFWHRRNEVWLRQAAPAREDGPPEVRFISTGPSRPTASRSRPTASQSVP